MKILCVEDGSVDIDTIENGELTNCKLLVYRQGSKPPFVLDISNDEKDKIDFTVEQLEKVKEKINCCPMSYYDTNKHFIRIYQSDAIAVIDNQIKELKKELE